MPHEGIVAFLRGPGQELMRGVVDVAKDRHLEEHREKLRERRREREEELFERRERRLQDLQDRPAPQQQPPPQEPEPSTSTPDYSAEAEAAFEELKDREGCSLCADLLDAIKERPPDMQVKALTEYGKFSQAVHDDLSEDEFEELIHEFDVLGDILEEDLMGDTPHE